ncbi:MAG: EamA family transporter [Cyclobacteriaceae bacterium]|nr:EamA family transporter [Cyclobacteriaceae bacterium]MCX7637360.1 EamA family transporter [Cyclobacteriaceae bacterium]MDW8330060.1 EamA family transporter [Cyclobacteriaceae bacterium]
MKKSVPVLPYLALLAVSLIWGTTYLALRIGVMKFPPFLFTAIRQMCAGMLLFTPLFFTLKTRHLSFRYVLQQAVAGFFLITLGNGLVAWAEVYVPSGVAAVLCSLLPVAVILINLLVYHERPAFVVVFGTLLGLGGMLLMFSEHLADLGRLEYRLGIFWILIAVLSWASGSLWLKKQQPDFSPFMNAALQMFFGGLFCLIFSFVFDKYDSLVWTTEAIYALIYLILFGSILAYASYLYALRTLPIALVSVYAYINPVVAVVLGWLVLDEKLNLRIVFAIIVVLIGIFLVNRGYRYLGKRISGKN